MATGGLTYLNMLGQPMIIVNSHETAVALLDKRSVTYSDRPPLKSSEFIGYSNTLPLTRYGDRLRDQRRLLNQTLGTRQLVEKFGPLEEHATYDFLQRLLKHPDGFAEHVKRYPL